MTTRAKIAGKVSRKPKTPADIFSDKAPCFNCTKTTSLLSKGGSATAAASKIHYFINCSISLAASFKACSGVLVKETAAEIASDKTDSA